MNWLQQIAEWFNKIRFWYTVRPWEQAIRVRCGRWTKSISPGLHLRFPILDEVFCQNVRQRVLNLPVQTVSIKSGQAVTLSGAVRWRISDVSRIYHMLHTPEDWIYNTVLSAIAAVVFDASAEVSPQKVSELATLAVQSESVRMGLEIEAVSITDFAMVRTYRLISGEGNTGWTWNRVGSLDAAQGH